MKPIAWKKVCCAVDFSTESHAVAESTVRRAECPVMVVHSEWTGLS